MRSIKTFILRLYTDSETPGRLCGDLQALPRRKTFAFKDEIGFISILHRLLKEEAHEFTLKPSPEENEPDLPGVKDSAA
jgi:hypothetical protein